MAAAGTNGRALGDKEDEGDEEQGEATHVEVNLGERLGTVLSQELSMAD